MHKIKGQSILEYTVLIMLIIVIVMVMGPYVIRSINAHFKIWQESIDDSVNDRMTGVFLQLPPDKCTCGAMAPGQCGGHFQFQNKTCPLNQRYRYTPCTPSTCGLEQGLFKEDCVDDPTCCGIYNACSNSSSISGCCGTVVAPQPPRTTTDPNGLPSIASPAPNPNNPSSYCYYGEEIMYNQCDHTKIHCLPNDQCKPMCTGTLPHDASGNLTATLCPGADAGLTQDTPISVVGGCAGDPPPPPPPACYVAPLPTNADTTFCFNNSGCIKVNCDASFSAGSNCNGAPTCTMPVYIPGYTNNAACKGTSPLNDDAASITKFCQSLGFSSGSLTTRSYSDDCGWVTYWNGSAWKTRDEGNGGQRKFAYKIKCTASSTTPTTPPITPPTVCVDACPAANSSTKCVAECNPGFTAKKDSKGNVYCSFCQPQTLADYVNTAQGAGGQVAYTSPLSETATTFKVEVWTEDLNFVIQFLDENGVTIKQETCWGSTRTPLSGALNNSCGGKDDDDSIDHYIVSSTANQVSLKVLEGGSSSSGSFGYKVQADLCGKPSSPLSCTEHEGANVQTASGSGLVKGTCPAGEYLAGYCVKSTGGSDNKNYAREWARTADSVTLSEGNDSDNDNSVKFEYYCYPCTCPGGKCSYLTYDHSRTTKINHYSGNPTTVSTCY